MCFPAHKCTKKSGAKTAPGSGPAKALEPAVINKKKFYQQIVLRTFVIFKNDTFVGAIQTEI